MRAVVADSSAPGRIALQDVPEPVAAPGEVLVDVRAFSINRGEMRMLGMATDGWRPGWDFAGTLRRQPSTSATFPHPSWVAASAPYACT